MFIRDSLGDGVGPEEGEIGGAHGAGGDLSLGADVPEAHPEGQRHPQRGDDQRCAIYPDIDPMIVGHNTHTRVSPTPANGPIKLVFKD